LHNGRIKLGDFGAAKLWIKGNPAGNMAGSPCYLAPEVITAGQELGPKGARDVWALGCLLFEMVLGRRPWLELDNVSSLYFLIGTWSLRASDSKR
jgi:serine/threonine protein kinase